MKDNWKQLVEKYLDTDWRYREEYVWAIVCWSYVTWNPSMHSDIDLHIILDESCSRRERWNLIIEGLMVEYFANPPKQHTRYFESDYTNRRRINSHMFKTWVILEDKKWVVKNIVKEAKIWHDRCFESMSLISVSMKQYMLWDQLDNLKEMQKNNDLAFQYAYYQVLNSCIEFYSAYTRFPKIQPNKIYRFLQDSEDKKKYNIPDFPDQKFVQLLLSAFIRNDIQSNSKVIDTLVTYILENTWWFEVNGWKLRSDRE